MESLERNMMNENVAVTKSGLLEEIRNFTSTPFLFIGSGFSRRYLKTPDWKNLIKHFAEIARGDSLAFGYYKARVESQQASNVTVLSDLYPEMASLIQQDYNTRWFDESAFREENGRECKDDDDPFHAAISRYIDSFKLPNSDEKLSSEINLFKSICQNNVSGIITTNYDQLLEELSGFNSYIGQGELLSKSTSGVGEIYKIHGSILKPNSIVITRQDYDSFDKKSQYLSAKLITIFMENPIFFIGYSIQDKNIIGLLRTIVNCFDQTEEALLARFQKKLFFVDYDQSCKGIALSDFTLSLNDEMQILRMKKITLPEYLPLFEALSKVKNRLPIKTLRTLQRQFSQFIVTTKPNTTIQVADLKSRNIEDNDYAIYIGTKEHIESIKGLVGKELKDVYWDIIFDNIGYKALSVLEVLRPKLEKSNVKIPIYKYYASLSEDEMTDELAKNFKDTQYGTITKAKRIETRSIQKILDEDVTILEDSPVNGQKTYNVALTRIMEIPEDRVVIPELLSCIKKILTDYPNVFINGQNNNREINPTNVRRLIRAYDYLEYRKRAMENLNLWEESSP